MNFPYTTSQFTSVTRLVGQKPATSIASKFLGVRQQTLQLIEGLSEEDCALQSMPDASPVKWHLAHTSWFFEVFILEKFEPSFAPFDTAFRVLFNSYYNAVGQMHPRPERGLISRPGLERVLQYRQNIDQRILVLLDQSRDDPALAALIELGVQHEQQHQELILTDLKHLFSCNPLYPAYRQGWPLVTAYNLPLEWIGFEGGLVSCGKEVDDTFCFDNETPRHQTYLRPYELASLPILNSDVLAFIHDQGYQRAELWLSMGWNWVQSSTRQSPDYWLKSGSNWHIFTLRGLAKLSEDVPATHLSYFEADAIARWKGARLPSEAEWEHAARGVALGGNFQDTGVFHPLALQGTSLSAQEGIPPSARLHHFWGDNWEWTQSQYTAYPGFRAAAGAIGEYNGKFMCNQFVLRGGSCATPISHIRSTYRNFFPPNATWQFSGARLARDLR